MAVFREAVRLNPKYDQRPQRLGREPLAAGPDGVRDGKRAVEHAGRACELSGWMNPQFIETLAAAHAEAGDFDKAVEFQKKALSFPAFEKARGPDARERVAQYQRKQSYRDPALARRARSPHRCATIRWGEILVAGVS